MFVLDKNDAMSLYAQLYQQIKNDILKGNIKPGTKLLSSRKLAMDLRISRNTVELAYDKLTELKEAQAHSTVILNKDDEQILRSLGISFTCDPVYPSKNLFYV